MNRNKCHFFSTFQNSDAELSTYRLKPLHSHSYHHCSHLHLYIYSFGVGLSNHNKYDDYQHIFVIILGTSGPFISAGLPMCALFISTCYNHLQTQIRINYSGGPSSYLHPLLLITQINAGQTPACLSTK